VPTIVSREQYFDAALEMLADTGFKGLNIGRMCKTLGVTSGSFYHYFGSWPTFVDALLEFWQNRQVVILRELDWGTSGPEADFAALMKLTLGLRHEAEAAIRAWAMNDETVRVAQKRVDNARLKTVGKAVLGIVGDRATADVVTSLGLAMLVGHQQLGEDSMALEKLLGEYTRLVYSHARE
jgi:AcrR family transcriptional regulator